MIIDALQYNNWSEKIFNQLREGGVTAVHVTITYHEDFRETVENIIAWNRRFEQFPDLIRPAGSAEEVQAAARENRTAILSAARTVLPSRMTSDWWKSSMVSESVSCSFPTTTRAY